MNEDGHRNEIIIIKRGNEEEEGHHGGAWKIAFADFMTAMMALFLVLWLINAANEETKRAVASYFNPIKLVDRNRSTKGVSEQKGGQTASEELGGAMETEEVDRDKNLTTKSLKASNSPTAKSDESKSDEAFFADPFAALDKIEASMLEKQGISHSSVSKSGEEMPGKFTDPFNSGFWEGKEESNPVDAAKRENEPVTSVPADQPTTDLASEKVGTAAEAHTPILSKVAKNTEEEKIHEEVRAEIGKSLKRGIPDETAISVTRTDKGVLIQITDTAKNSMFDIGRAVPNGETLIAVNAIAKSLQKRKGTVQIYGHTDGRKYQNVAKGNWQLSLDRAQAIYLTLLRAGLAEERVAQITGFADRKLLVTEDPLADRNRRIEIFLETR